MPWKKVTQGKKKCVADKDGKVLHCYSGSTADKQCEEYMAALYANAAKSEKLEARNMSKVQMKRPVMLGVALTNRPHIRLKEHPIEIIEENGQAMVRVPFMVAGSYAHPNGELDFTPDVFQAFLENQEKDVADNDLGLDAKHDPDRGMWAWFEPKLGGRVAMEITPKGERLLVGIGKPTGPDAVEKLKNSVFRYASLEFHPNYRSNRQRTYLSQDFIDEEVNEVLSADDLHVVEVITLFNPFHSKANGQFAGDDANKDKEELEGETMFELTLNEDGGVTLDAKQVKTLQTLVADSEKAAETITALEAKVTELEVKLAEKPVELEEAPVSDNEKVLLERVAKLEREAKVANVDAIIEKAKNRVDENGYAHSAVMLNTMRALMLGEPINNTIKLEEGGDYQTFVLEACKVMLTTMPGQQKVTTETKPDETRELEDAPANKYEEGRKDGKLIHGK